MIMLRLFSSVLIVGLASAQAPQKVADHIKTEGLENSQAMAFLDHLTNKIGHRLTGSDNFLLAAQWARAEFDKMGLDAQLEKWGEWNIIWNRGQWSGRVLSPTPMDLHVATPAWTAGTKGQQKGRLVKARSPEDVEQYDEPVFVYLEGRLGGRRGGGLGAWAELDNVLGIVQSSRNHGGADRRYENQIRVFGSSQVAKGSWDKLPTIPQIVVRDDHAAELEELLSGPDAGSNDEGAERPAPVMVQFEIRNKFRKGPVPLYNVIAELKGSEKPDEYVVVCGHLDSWHQAAGCTDNGTGTTSTMEAARILTAVGAKPKRTIRFALWGGEEQGLLGSRQHVVMRRTEMEKVSCVFNHDTGTNWASSLSATEGMYADLQKVLAPVMTMTPPIPEEYDGEVFKLSKTSRIGGGGGSDHASFLSAGVPAWSWGLRGRTSYGYGWHSQWDTYDIAVPEYQAHTSTVIALAALGVANLPGLLSRDGVGGRGGRSGGSSRLGAFVGRFFGAELDELTFKAVEKGGLAATAGVQKGDVLTALWDEKVESLGAIFAPWRDHRDDEIVRMTVKRGGKTVKLEAKRPSDGGNPSQRRRRQDSAGEGDRGRGGDRDRDQQRTLPKKEQDGGAVIR